MRNKDAFEEFGFVRVEGAFPRADADLMVDLIWGVFERKFGIMRGDPSTWDRPYRKGPINELGSRAVFWNIFSDQLIGVIDEILRPGRWALPEALGDFLITFPNTSTWELPHDGMPGFAPQGWHCDEGSVPGVMGFMFLNDVEPRGGGTLVVQGSHWLARPDERSVIKPDGAASKWRLRWEMEHQAQWLRELRTPGDAAARYRQFVEDTTIVEGVPLKVVELTGKGGDAFLCHPRLIHAVAPNALSRPRLMRTPRIGGVREGSAPAAHSVSL